MTVALFAVGLNLSGVAYAATGGNFILGQTNTANKPTALSATATGGAALKVTNNAAKPAVGLFSPTGVAPFTVSNKTKITNLNADLLDGVDSAAFARKADTFETHYVLPTGTESSFDLGPYLTILFNCSSAAGSTVFNEQLLDNATVPGEWFSSDVITNWTRPGRRRHQPQRFCQLRRDQRDRPAGEPGDGDAEPASEHRHPVLAGHDT